MDRNQWKFFARSANTVFDNTLRSSPPLPLSPSCEWKCPIIYNPRINFSAWLLSSLIVRPWCWFIGRLIRLWNWMRSDKNGKKFYGFCGIVEMERGGKKFYFLTLNLFTKISMFSFFSCLVFELKLF